MHRVMTALFFSAAILSATVAHAETPSYIGQHISTLEDISAITKVTEDFRQALINKDSRQMSALLLNSDILFSSAPNPQQIRNINEKYDANFNGIFSGGFGSFTQFLGSKDSPSPEEKFYNMKITQDGNSAWIMFDYEFLTNKKMQNYGIESWQLIKTADEKWKIISVFWSSHPAPNK